jgi:excisionase family DNA binding protein
MAVKYLQTYEVAKRVGYSSETIRLWERQGRIPAIKTSRGMRLFLEEDVARLEAELRRKAAREGEGAVHVG